MAPVRRFLPHGRRAVAVGALSVAALLGGAYAATAELGSPGDTAPASAEASPAPTASDGAPGTGNGDNNVALAVNDKDGKEVWAVRLKIVRTSKEVVDPVNAAVAVASCENCSTYAIALEGVLVWGDPEQVTPTNLALALNQDCSGCQTLASAYQKVTSYSDKVRITGEGRRTIASLRQQLHTLRTRGLTFEQVVAEVERITADFAAVLEDEVVPVGKPAEATPSASGNPSPTASPEATQDAASTPVPTDTNGAGESSPTPTPEATGSPMPTETTAP